MSDTILGICFIIFGVILLFLPFYVGYKIIVNAEAEPKDNVYTPFDLFFDISEWIIKTKYNLTATDRFNEYYNSLDSIELKRRYLGRVLMITPLLSELRIEVSDKIKELADE